MREPSRPHDSPRPPADADADSGDAADGADANLKPRRPKRRSTAQTIGGVLFGFEQQVWRTAPPPQELVHHARPDAPVPAADGTMLTIEFPPALDEPAKPGDDHDDQGDGGR
jgi:hypothetical protein